MITSSHVDVLKMFLELPVESASPILDIFKSLPGVIARGHGLEQFVYVRGLRPNKALLVAHADTVWDTAYGGPLRGEHPVIMAEGVIRSADPSVGLGADDRAGCALLWLLRDMGHSLLITHGEEHGAKGSRWLMGAVGNEDLAQEINSTHQFMIQLDRRNGRDFKCYSVGTEQFRSYLQEVTGYSEPDRQYSTDIVVLCRDVTGVNLSVGYHSEHTPQEYLCLAEWTHTLEICQTWLAQPALPRFDRPPPTY